MPKAKVTIRKDLFENRQIFAKVDLVDFEDIDYILELTEVMKKEVEKLRKLGFNLDSDKYSKFSIRVCLSRE